MIRNNDELKTTQERIAQFESWVAQFRVSVPRENFPAMVEGYLAEIGKMHTEVMTYLRHHPSEPAAPKAA